MNVFTQLTRSVKSLAAQVGFARAGIAPAAALGGLEKFKSFLSAGYAGEMDYLTRNVEKRFNPAMLVPGAKSVISLAVSYAPPNPDSADCSGRSDGAFVSRYARGRDYHKVLKKRCHALMDEIRRIAPQFAGRAFVDSAPIAERSAAVAAGLGWIGRNGCLIVPGLGSYVFLAEIVCNLELEPDSPFDDTHDRPVEDTHDSPFDSPFDDTHDSPFKKTCGDCRACLDACPSGACIGNGLIDSRRCYSYLTIEHRGDVPDEFKSAWGRRIFGCDDCQSACPHNRNVPCGDAELTGENSPQVRNLNAIPISEILDWNESEWDIATRGSATRRARFESFIRNAHLAARKSD